MPVSTAKIWGHDPHTGDVWERKEMKIGSDFEADVVSKVVPYAEIRIAITKRAISGYAK
jgi:hypothetical protein